MSKDLLAIALELGGDITDIVVEPGRPRFIRSCDECGNHRVVLCNCGHFACREHTAVIAGMTICTYCLETSNEQ